MVGILGANSVSGGYEIDNSLRFNDGDSSQLNSTNVGTVTLGTKFTYSVWLKKTAIVTANQNILSADSGGNIAQIYFRSGSNDAIKFLETPDTFSSFDTNLTTDALFRDPSAWYHIVVAYDSTDGTAANRVKIYSNGVLQTLTGTTANENYTTPFNEASYNLDIGHSKGGEFFDGYMSDANFIDGQTLAPTDFGEFNDNGVWIPKAYTGTYGTNGFYLEFKQTGTGTDASGMGADTSGNDHHWAVTNLAATDVTTDTPTNNFATMNPLYLRTSGAPVFSEGNTFSDQSAANTLQFSTILVTQGKWYMEVKVVAVGGAAAVGISDPSIYDNGNPDTKIISYRSNGQKKNLGTDSSYGNTFTTGDIIGIAFNADDGEIFFYKNGTAENSGTAAFTGIDTSGGYVIGSIGYNGEASNNYGNPSYTISSGNADANGYGNFEYAVPSGFYSLCTKNLAEFG